MWRNPKSYADEGAATQAPPEPTGELLAAVLRPGSRGEADADLRIKLDEYEGRPFLGMRLWEARGGVYSPTRKGVTIRLSEAAEVAAAILEGLEPVGGPPEPRGPRGRSGRPAGHPRAVGSRIGAVDREDFDDGE